MGGPPARLKGLLDRCLTPGYAFRHRQDGSWDKLLTGKTAQLLTTMDTPTWVYRLVYGNPGIRMLERATLAYCGVRSVRRTLFSPVVESSHAQRLGWIEKTRQEGLRLAEGVMTPGQRKLDHLLAWLRALRLQFYPMSFVAYLIGALTATEEAVALDHIRFWIGYAVLFLLEAATVFTNERFDLNSDRRNNNAGPFNGGSRVLVEGAIDLSTMRRVTGSILILCTVVAFWLVLTGPAPIFPLLAWFVVLGIIAVGYTAPPLSLSHRGFGELDVAFTHSIGVMMVGHLVQGGSISDPVPWLLSLPLALSVLPAIILSGLPDQEADQAAGKRTLAVFFGKASAVHLAMLSAVLAVAAATLIALTPEAGHAMPILIVPLAGIHASLLLHALRQRLHDARLDGRINRLMVLALSFCLWFALLPLTALW